MAEQQTVTDESDPLSEQIGDIEVPTEAVECNLSQAYWWVDDCGWVNLPDDLVALLAPPIVVGVTPVVAKP
jgi:hypothetical protein